MIGQAWTPDRERGYNLRCTNCGRPTAKKTKTCKEAGLCKHCVQEILLKGRFTLYTDFKTGETIKGSPNFGIISEDGVKRKPRRRIAIRKSRAREREVIRTPRVRRKPRVRRAKEVDAAFKEKAGVVEETLKELGQ